MTWGTVFSGFKDNDWRIEPHENKTSYCIAKETIECTGSSQNSLSDSPSTILTLSGLARVVQFLGWLSSVSYSRTKPMPSSHPQAWIWMWEESPSDFHLQHLPTLSCGCPGSCFGFSLGEPLQSQAHSCCLHSPTLAFSLGMQLLP